MRGTWEVTDFGGGKTVPAIGSVLAIAALAWLATLLWLLALIGFALLAAIVVLVILIRRRPAADSEAFQHQAEALRVYAARQDRPQVAASGPAEVHYHTHLHIGPGADAAGIIRQALPARDAITHHEGN